MATAKRRGLIGIGVGVALTVLGPLGGLLTTMLSLNRAFGATGSPSVPPEDKAKNLAEGISESMNATAFGIVVGIIGMIVIIVSVIYIVRTNKKPTAAS